MIVFCIFFCLYLILFSASKDDLSVSLSNKIVAVKKFEKFNLEDNRTASVKDLFIYLES